MSKALFNIAYTAKTPPAKLKGEARADYIARRSFYDMTAGYNYFVYMLNERKVEKNKDALDYYTRGGTNSGLFNAKGRLSAADAGALKERLKSTDSIIWHGFLSFDEETSKGFTTQEQAIKFMRQSFNAFIDRTHLKRDNIELFAALHTDTAHHHHIHFAFFEKEPKRRDKNGKLGYTKVGSFEQKAIDNYLVAANMHLDENAYEYYSARDRAMESLKSIKLSALSEEKALRQKLSELARILPQEGRLQYNAEQIAPFHKDIDAAVNLLICSNPAALSAHTEMQRQFALKEAEVLRLAQENGLSYVNNRRLTKAQMQELFVNGQAKNITQEGIKLDNIDYIAKLRLDYQARLGNYVLGLVKSMHKEYRQPRRAKVNDLHLKIRSRRRGRGAREILHNVLKSLDTTMHGISRDFTKSLKQIEHEIQYEVAHG
ncbi:MAG: hypothetical protein FWH03_02635 [Firmicutes bacterium]|nr:hypothetical protein [Bacillota bacterium]